MIWWYWMVLGLLLLGLELATPGGFFLLFFGVGALLVGGLAIIGAAARRGCSGCSSRCSRWRRSCSFGRPCCV